MKQLRGILSAFRDMADNWNPDYWIYVAGGTLWVMKHDKNGERAMLSNGGVDPLYRVAGFLGILADGGDW
ncbi:hypothetical protein LCGC14_2359330 [marine sediment metagenome]|uniref:Uncharacterized protein n=1 Tax=marine sediment metagenome TaxID=412755 RepID=A0A0F9CUD4_9ZZZZ